MEATQLVLFDTDASDPTLDGVRAYLDAIPQISQGGCGVAALAIVRWLRTHGYRVHGQPFAVLRQAGYWDEWNHVAVWWHGNLLDSQCRSRSRRAWRIVRRLNETEMVRFVNRQIWNRSFSRTRWLPEIERELGIDLSDIRRR